MDQKKMSGANPVAAAGKRGIESYASVARMNVALILVSLVLFCYGLVILFSACMNSGSGALDVVFDQAKNSLIGVGAALVLIFALHVRAYNKTLLVCGAYILVLGLMIFTARFGIVEYGARRWVSIAGFRFQSSEVAKIGLVFFIAGYKPMIRRWRKKGRLRFQTKKMQSFMDTFMDFTLPVLLVGIILLLVLMQPHMSGFIILGVVCLICFLASGIRPRAWIEGGITLLVVGLVVGNILMAVVPVEMKDKFLGNFAHVGERLAIHETMNAEEAAEAVVKTVDLNDVDTAQSENSILAIASGGMRGLGLGQSRQKYGYLPVVSNDYVFSIACEELGFFGGVSIILLFLVFMGLGFYISFHAADSFCRILVLGYTTLIGLQAFLNIAVASGVIPPTGVTLPFFSSGGTANAIFMIALGFILAVSRTGVKEKKRIYL